jgi:hypothetical protein
MQRSNIWHLLAVTSLAERAHASSRFSWGFTVWRSITAEEQHAIESDVELLQIETIMGEFLNRNIKKNWLNNKVLLNGHRGHQTGQLLRSSLGQ